MRTSTGMSAKRANHDFSRAPQVDIPRSVFNRNSGLKTTFDAGLLIPIYVDEVLPGDTFDMTIATFGRIATLLKPIMDNIFLDVHFFSVPKRLLWNNWKKFNGEQTNPGDSTTFVIPQVVAPAVTGWPENSIGDYFGLPTKKLNLSTSALPFRAYNLIWNEWYRDQNLQSSATVTLTDGPDTVTNYTIRRRGKRHDYFTSSLPFAQKGNAVTLPLGTSAPVKTQPTVTVTGAQSALKWTDTSGGTIVTAGEISVNASGNTFRGGTPPASLSEVYPSNLYADLATATAATINQIRQAFQIQRLLERDARSGTRYTEVIRAHFGVTSPDARQQRPEYLGGGTVRLMINEIETTTEIAGTQPIGEQAGNGTFSGHVGRWRQSFTEHCVIMGIVSARADLNYQQGVERMWNRSTRFDFYWPALAFLGEQSILNKEIYYNNDANDNLVFGYQERHAEYRYKPNQVTGRMRSNATQPLDSWHLAQNFSTLPLLNATFIEETPPINRIIAVTTEPHFVADFFFSVKAARPMPVFGVPGMIDHF